MNIDLRLGDCLEVLKTLLDNSVDAIVCDPPYMLGFMGKDWDKGNDNIAANPILWQECLRVLKPGGHLLSFGGSRTYHRMAVAVEDAGFEIRDQIIFVYGSGFPKSLNIGKQLDKMGIEHEYSGYGTAMKPAHEDIVLAKKDGEDLMDVNTQPGFFYGSKANKKDRNEGIEISNLHPTVKPTDLMRYLINLITPPNGVVLDPFMGSGSTGKAAIRCGVNFIGIEKEQEYMDIAKARIEHEKNKPVQGKLL